MDADWPSALARARAHAPFLAQALGRRPDLAELLAAGEGETALSAAKASGKGAADTAIALRRERLALALVLAVGDLAGAFPLAQVMRELSLFADRALHAAIRAAIAARVEGGEARGFIGLALGKHGAGELNYSSDIDPILLYDPDALARRPREEPGEAAQRYAREIVRLLGEVTAEGYVFRVDLRLRPASEVSPLAIPLAGALSHYESSALAWERAAYIRARAAAGDIAAGEAFLDAIRPFVWRRSLDFGAIDEIRNLSRRIRDQRRGPGQPAPGWNVKLGRGGIREIEFFTQAHQMIHGGRDPSLRHKGTRAALDALAAAGHIAAADAALLGASYDGLRRIEHRLQMVADQQAHTLPAGEALDNVARLDGLAGAGALLDLCAALARPVAERFDAMLAEGDTPQGAAVAATLDDALGRRVAGWSDGRYRALRSAPAIAAFDAIRPALVASLAAGPDPAAAALHWEALLARTPSAINLFRLLAARPALMDQLEHVLALAPPLAEALGRRPDLLDTLIDHSALDLPGSAADLAAAMRRGERGDDYERILDRIRRVTGEKRFVLGVQLVEAAQDPLDVAAALSRTAEAAIEVAAEASAADFATRHGRIADSELVVLGLGRLGGGALTHASDLDIVFLFTGRQDGESDGPRPLGATLYYNRLAQRVSAALSVPTAAGALYEVDTRLRPQGAQGPLAVSLESFARYQREDAWTWEHMALTRAGVLTGSDEARTLVEAVVGEVLARPRDPDRLRADVLAMRAEMARHKPAQGLLDAKLRRGGLVDLEFLVHYLQLRERTALSPDLGAALAALAQAGLVTPALGEAYRLLTRLLVGTRLLAPDLAPTGTAADGVLARLCGASAMAELLAAHDRARAAVAAAWREAFDEELESTP